MRPVNLEAKNLLARLLATENVYIRHKKVKTASFDTVKRILTFPIWKEMSDELYTMLAAHEVGHALFTLRKRLDEIAKEIDPDNISIAAAYVNIIEDARIERLIKAMYPGLRRVFAIAYAELFDKNLFGTRHAEVNHRSFIDRANLYFKVGEHINPTFTEDERNMLHMIEETQTFDDVLRVTREIYEWAKKNNQHPDPIELPEEIIEQLKEALKNAKPSDDEDDEEDNSSSLNPTIKIKIPKSSDDDDDDEECDGGDDESNEGEGNDETDLNGSEDDSDGSDDGEDSGDGDEGNEDESEAECESEGAESKTQSKKGKKKSGKGKSKGKGKGKGKEQKDGDSDSEGESGDNDKPAKSNKKGKSDGKGEAEADGHDQKSKGGKQGQKAAASKNNNKKLKPIDPGPPPAPVTQENFDENVVQFNDEKTGDIIYVTTPKPILKNILVDYKDVHENLRLYFGGKRTILEIAEEEFLEFKQANQDKINYIFTQFEMKKQAEQYKRIRVHKTGSIDTLRLHAYKYEDDLFRSVASILDAKNHGLLFVIDWSASMQSSMAGTIEQLISLTMFCRKAQIPFEVYSLTTGTRNAFDSKPGDLVYSYNFRMRNYLSSRMNQQEYYQACINLFALMPVGDFTGGPVADNLIGCTPLDEAIVTAIDLIAEIRNRTKAQVINAVFLTDGGANTVSQYMDENGTKRSMNHNDRFVIEDRFTRKHYEFSGNYREMTPMMLRILRDRQNINAVGFYVTSSFDYMFSSDDDGQTKKHEKEFNEHGYTICDNWGFNELYIMKGGENLRVKTPTMKVTSQPGTPNFIQEVTKKFAQHGASTLKQRLMLDRFVKMIA